MNKTITLAMPDEPYKTTTAKGETFDIVYTGPRYVLIQVDRDDHEIREMRRGEKADEANLDPAPFEQDAYAYVTIDAKESDFMTLVAAYVTGEYTHIDIPDYEETMTDADGNEFTWNHTYEAGTGMLGHVYWNNSIKYNPETTTWSGPDIREHVNTRQSVLETSTVTAAIITAALADSDQTFSDADRANLTTYAAWLADLDRLYAGINHWKWPWSSDPIPYYENPQG